MIHWKEEYNIGIPEIDKQHKKLFKITDEAYELLKDEFMVDKYDKIVQVIQELKDYTVFHFNCEEEYMKNICYKKLLSHKVQHDDFIEKINSVNLYNVDENQDEYIIKILDFVINWITNHILIKDKLIVLQKNN